MDLAINPDRIVPVKEDLSTPVDTFEIIRGWNTMHRVSKPLATGVVCVEGEWLVLGDNGKLTRPSATPVPNTFLVLDGTNRFDTAATGEATIIMNSKIVVRTKRYDTGASYSVGTYLTVKDLGAGQAIPTAATGVEPKLAMVVGLGNGFLEYATL